MLLCPVHVGIQKSPYICTKLQSALQALVGSGHCPGALPPPSSMRWLWSNQRSP